MVFRQDLKFLEVNCIKFFSGQSIECARNKKSKTALIFGSFS